MKKITETNFYLDGHFKYFYGILANSWNFYGILANSCRTDINLSADYTLTNTIEIYLQLASFGNSSFLIYIYYICGVCVCGCVCVCVCV